MGFKALQIRQKRLMRLAGFPVCQDATGDRVYDHSVKTGDLREFFSNDPSRFSAHYGFGAIAYAIADAVSKSKLHRI